MNNEFLKRRLWNLLYEIWYQSLLFERGATSFVMMCKEGLGLGDKEQHTLYTLLDGCSDETYFATVCTQADDILANFLADPIHVITIAKECGTTLNKDLSYLTDPLEGVIQ